MARHANAVMGTSAYAQYAFTPVVDISKNRSNGYASDFSYYVSNAQYVSRPMMAFVIELPRGFNDLDNPAYWNSTAKAIFERLPQRIEGLRSTLTVENVEVAVGGDGNMQEDPSNVTRERSVPVTILNEKYGMPINKFLEGWITHLIMNPVSKVPDVVTMGLATPPPDMLPDYTSATVLFVEPDPTFSRPQKAWLCTNMRPKTGGQVEGVRDLTQGGEALTYNVEWTALTMVGVGVMNLAQGIMNDINLTGTNPNLRDAFVTNISADVAAATGAGYANQVNEMAASFVEPDLNKSGVL